MSDKQPQRDKNGRFLPGNTVRTGRVAKKQTYDRVHTLIHETLDDETWKQIIAKAAEQAIKGSASARADLLKYGVGMVDVDDSSGGPALQWDWDKASASTSSNDSRQPDDKDKGEEGENKE
jgi:hypothetical protein